MTRRERSITNRIEYWENLRNQVESEIKNAKNGAQCETWQRNRSRADERLKKLYQERDKIAS